VAKVNCVSVILINLSHCHLTYVRLPNYGIAGWMVALTCYISHSAEYRKFVSGIIAMLCLVGGREIQC